METTTDLDIKWSELRYRRLFEAAKDGILILDAQTGAISDVNPFLIDLLGYSREQFIHKKLWEVGAFSDIEASQQAFEALQKNEYIRYKNLPLRSTKGKLIQVEFVSNVYLEGDKKVIQCNIRDITDRKLAEDDLVKREALFHEQSVRDHLTGLFNRRYLEETLEREIHRALRKHLFLGIVMVDIDDFKQFNDTYGHAAGDLVLCEVGKLLNDHIRVEDIACRYGGDEFMIVLPDASQEVMYSRAEKIRSEIKNIHLHLRRKTLGEVTLSLGLASFPKDGRTSSAILKAVDDALLFAKREGRDRVIIAEKKPSRVDILWEESFKID